LEKRDVKGWNGRDRDGGKGEVTLFDVVWPHLEKEE